MVNNAMSTIWNRNPNEFQLEAIARLLLVRVKQHTPSALLLVQGTGSGKSMVSMTVGITTCGVTLIIENTQSLSADQMSKFDIANAAYGPVKAFQLDSIKDDNVAEKLAECLTSLDYDTNVSVFLYSSPEAMLKPLFLQMIHKLIDNGIIRLTCIDEVRQFVNFGTSFRPGFGDLRRALFSKIIQRHADPQFHNSSPVPVDENCLLKIPVSLMTATMNFDLLQQLQLLVGIKTLHGMMLWGGRNTFKRHAVKITMNVTSSNMNVTSSTLSNVLSKDVQKK